VTKKEVLKAESCDVSGCSKSMPHTLANCGAFKARSLESKESIVSENKTCWRCLEHTREKPCSKTELCPVTGCYGGHHYLLHGFYVMSIEERRIAKKGGLPRINKDNEWPLRAEGPQGPMEVAPIFLGCALGVPPGQRESIVVLFSRNTPRSIMERGEALRLGLEVERLACRVQVRMPAGHEDTEEKALVSLAGPVRDGEQERVDITVLLVRRASK